MISPAIAAIAIAVMAALAFGGGFAVADWRSGAKVAVLTSNNAVLTAVNDKCATDIVAVREAIAAMKKAAAEREKAAAVSMVVATRSADKHTAKARRIRTYPPVSMDMQCEAVKREQVEYVRDRAQ